MTEALQNTLNMTWPTSYGSCWIQLDGFARGGVAPYRWEYYSGGQGNVIEDPDEGWLYTNNPNAAADDVIRVYDATGSYADGYVTIVDDGG